MMIFITKKEIRFCLVRHFSSRGLQVFGSNLGTNNHNHNNNNVYKSPSKKKPSLSHLSSSSSSSVCGLTSYSKVTRLEYIEHPKLSAKPIEEVNVYLKENELKIKGEPPLPRPITSLDETNFPWSITKVMKSNGINTPTPIQAIGWPVAMNNRDLIGIAQTGSGKTLSFLLPALMHISIQPVATQDGYKGKRSERGMWGGGPTVLIMAPTRELTCQIYKEAEVYAKIFNIKCACIYGGTGRYKQQNELLQGCELVVATPGRLIDFIDAGVLKLNNTSYFVLDEADRMLDMGFEPQIKQIVNHLREDRQTLMWSATWPSQVQFLARSLCKEQPVELYAGSSSELRANPMIVQKFISVAEIDKRRRLFELMKELHNNTQESSPIKLIIFCNTKKECADLCRNMRYQQYAALAIHGDKTQIERDNILQDYRSNRCNILIATDVAARGLDIKNINYVLNYDLPKTTEDYVHRIGRTARAGKTGEAITFIANDNYRSPETYRMLKSLAQLIQSSTNQSVPSEIAKLLSHK